MRLWHSIFLLSVLLVVGGCQTKLFDRVDQSVDNAKQQIDDSIDRAEERIRTLVREARESVSSTLDDARDEYKGALKDTSAEVEKLRTDLKRDLEDLDRRSQERIEQIRSGSLELIKAGDAAVQARIDQLFTDLRLFMAETLTQVAKLIEPVLKMADKIGNVADSGNQAVREVLTRLIAILDAVKDTVTDVRKTIQQIRGVNPETGETTGIAGWISMILTAIILAMRKLDSLRNGERWKADELEDKTRTDVEKHLKAGTFDDEIAGRILAGAFDDHLRARLVHFGVVRVSSVTVPPKEGGDPSSPQVPGGPISP